MNRALFLLASTASLASCAHDPTAPINIVADYELVTVNGAPVPLDTSIEWDPTHITIITKIVEGWLFIEPDGVFSMVLAIVGRDREGDIVPSSVALTRTYQRRSNTITFDFGALGQRTGRASLAGGKRTITLDDASGLGVLVFRESSEP